MPVILFVDDEPQILRSLQRVFREWEGYEYYFAESPKEALEVLAAREVTVLVSDHKMPLMPGAEFLARVKEKRPDTVRILLTGQADLDAVQHAVNRGEVFRFFLKPWNDDELRAAVRQAVQMHDLTCDNRRLVRLTTEQNEQLHAANEQLESQVATRTQQLSDALYTARSYNEQLVEGLHRSGRAMFEIGRMARPGIGSHAQRVAQHAVEIGRLLQLDSAKRDSLQIAALLHDIGKLGIPPFVAEKHPQDLQPGEWNIYRTHPVIGSELFDGISRFNDVARFILMHHERQNGTGFPAGRHCEDIPMEAMVIGLMDEYDHLTNRQQYTAEFNYQFACQQFAEYSDREYPSALIQASLNCMASLHGKTTDVETRLGISDLAPNLVLSRDVYSMSGHLLLPCGTRLNAQKIYRLRAIAKLDPLAGEITVYKHKQQTETRT